MLSFLDRYHPGFMQNFQRLLPVVYLLLFSFSALTEAKAQSSFQASIGPLFTVNSPADSIDSNVGDGICSDAQGRCTLRAAIEESNYEPVANAFSINVIIFALPNPSVIDLTQGELTITSGTWIFGTGARNLTVQRSLAPGTGNFRVFRIAAANGGVVDLRRLTIKNGNAGIGNGGGIFVEAGNGASLADVAITENSAANGGGIASAGQTLIVNRVLLSLNNASSNGGGIFNQGGIPGPRIVNTTITGNFAARGGGVYNSGTVWLVNDTITNNGVSEAAVGIFNEAGSVNVLNTLIGAAPATSPSVLSGAFTSKGNNFVGDARNSTGFAHGVNNDLVSGETQIDPMFGLLVNNGGHTDTRALLPGSPAIDAGNDCVLTASCDVPFFSEIVSDQRGRYHRKNGNAVDIGAFESGGGPPLETISFGALPRPGRPAFFSGAIAVLTSATTGEKIYSAVKPFGGFRFQDLPVDFYILEIKGKRYLTNGSPVPIGLDDIPLGPVEGRIRFDRDLGFRLIVEKDPNSRGVKSAIQKIKMVEAAGIEPASKGCDQ